LILQQAIRDVAKTIYPLPADVIPA